MICTHSLPGMEDVERQLREAIPDGYVAISPLEREYLLDRSDSATITSESQSIVLPLPNIAGADSLSEDELDSLQDYADEAMRTLVIIPERAYRALMDATYPEVMIDAIIAAPKYSWLPSPNYTNDSRGASNIYYDVVHTTEGPYDGSVGWLRNPQSQASCHPCMNFAGTKSAVLVSDEDQAWCAGHATYNKYGLHREHEGYAARGGFTEAFYQLSARWSAHHLTKFKIPVQLGCSMKKSSAYRAGIITHNSIPYPSTHTDPGPHFDLEKLLSYTKRIIAGDAPTEPRPTTPKPDPAIVRVTLTESAPAGKQVFAGSPEGADRAVESLKGYGLKAGKA